MTAPDLPPIANWRSVIAVLAFEGLTTDGAHHKQWYLEEIIRVLGFDMEAFQEATGYAITAGIAP